MVRNRFVYRFSPGSADRPGRNEIGGKALNLVRLMEMNQPVPGWFGITVSAFRQALAESGFDGRIRNMINAEKDASRLAADLEAIRKLIAGMDIPAAIVSEIREAYRTTAGSDGLVAVRSSASDEDNAELSFAGLHDSFLFIKGEESVINAVRKVWASAYNDRAISYRRETGLRCDSIAVAVVAQKMVDASVSGVMFTANPVSGNVGEIVISSLYGAGEGLVSAGFDADIFTVKKENLSIQAAISSKQEALILDSRKGAGLVKIAVPAARSTEPSLADEQVVRVAKAGLVVENVCGRPQDIEFSFDQAGNLFLLQARPVTTLKEYGPAAGNHLVWDNSNIIESYSGVTSPMTFSFIRRAYCIVYNCFCEVMGIPEKTIHAHQDMFANMLGLFRGQVYYNLLNWYRLVRLFPGFDYNKGFMESMMGVKEPAELRDKYRRPGLLARYFVELPRLVRLLVRSSYNFSRIRKLVSAFDQNFQRHYREWAGLNFREKKPHELMAIYRDMEDRLLWNWKAPIINDFFVMIFYGTLKKLCQRWCGDTQGSLQNDLICGEGGIESTEPTRMLIELASIAAKTPGLKALIIATPAAEAAKEIPDDSRFCEFNDMLTRYLDLYGFRCMNELKLEEYSLRDRPEFVFKVIRNYLSLERTDVLDIVAIHEREQKIRREAEARAFASVKGLRKPIFRWVLNNARLGVKNRENMRFARTKIYGLLRELIRAMGSRFAEEGIIADPEDIFCLTLDECFDFIKGTAVTTRLGELAKLRRAEFDEYRSHSDAMPDDRFDTYGMAYHRNFFRNVIRETRLADDGTLRGIGCCPGEVTGPVMVLKTPKDDMRLSGEILVAERTDPGWVPLYPSVSGILIERGSILSHSAIVAREMGIPTIVGIPGLTATLVSGQKVVMNGSSGIVKLVDKLV